LMGRWLTIAGHWPAAPDLETALTHAAEQILAVALTAEAVALHRLLTAEGSRFPELPRLLNHAGGQAGVNRIAALLDQAVERGEMPHQDTANAAEQFMHLLLAGPQRRALGLGPKLTPEQLEAWRTNAIRLFLHGIMR
jgi:TetR/AcrR family transcriptional regulator, mexJK operon transcriptional repressor